MKVGMNSDKLNIKTTDDYFPCTILCNNNEIEKTDVSIISYGGVSKIIEPLMVEMANEEILIDCMFVTEISNIELTCYLIENLKSENLLFIEEGTEKFNWSSGIIAELAKKNDNNGYQYFNISAMDYIIPASLDAELEVLPSLEKIKNQVMEIL
jgi:pyruvate/2-oxoglutarate/acetoin dehydrogenase E1 component